MQSLVKLSLWVLSGLVLGSLIWYAFLQPTTVAPPSGNPPSIMQNGTPLVVPPVQNTTNPQNTTSPPQNNSTASAPKQPISLALIQAPDCERCYGGQNLLESAKNVLNESSTLRFGSSEILAPDSEKAKGLISKYSITMLPVVIMSGNVTADAEILSAWTTTVGTIEADGTLVSRKMPPPYYDMQAKRVVGFVQGIAISPYGCNECINVSTYFESLADPYIGMVFLSNTTFDENSTEGQALIKKYNITKLPALLLDKEVQAYPFFEKSIKPSGTVEQDGWYVFRAVQPPFVDLSQNRSIRGSVDSIHIVNSSCTDCFDITGLADYLENAAGLFVMERTTYEINSTEGGALVKKYNITKIPTLIYSPEASVYPNFDNAWLAQNNTIEGDGWYVFRTVEISGQPYQNVSAG